MVAALRFSHAQPPECSVAEGVGELSGTGLKLGEMVAAVVQREYERAAQLVDSDGQRRFIESLPQELRDDIKKLGSTRHNGRGVVITLSACKAARREQDIRCAQGGGTRAD